MGSIGGGKSKQAANAAQGIRGTSLEGPVTARMGTAFTQGSDIASEAARSPFGFFRGTRVGANTGSPNDIAPTGRYGASAAIDTGLEDIMRSQFNKHSANAVARGQTSPENTAGIIGSAGRGWAREAAPMIQEWQRYITELPSKLWSNALGFAFEPFRQGSASLGGESKSTANAVNAGLSVASSGQPAGSTGPVCWIAEVLYGPLTVDTWLLRMYLTTEKAHTWYVNLYRSCGRTVAKWVEKSTLLRMILKPLFDRGVKAARAHYGR